MLTLLLATLVLAAVVYGFALARAAVVSRQ